MIDWEEAIQAILLFAVSVLLSAVSLYIGVKIIKLAWFG
jgi:hypothetical protein